MRSPTYREGGEQYPVKIRVLEDQRRDIDTLGKLTVSVRRRGTGAHRQHRPDGARLRADAHHAAEPAVRHQPQRRRRARARARRGVERRPPPDRRPRHAGGLLSADAGTDAQSRRDHRQPDHGDRPREHLRLHGARSAVRELRAAARHHAGAAAVGAVRALHDLGHRPDAQPVERARHPAALRHRQEELDSAGGLHQRAAIARRAAPGGGHRGVPHAAAADPDDDARRSSPVCCRRRSASASAATSARPSR